MFIIFIILILGECHGERFVSFPDARNDRSESIVTGVQMAENVSESENLVQVKAGPKNLAFVPVIIPGQQPATLPSFPTVQHPFPVVGWPFQSQSTSSVANPVNVGPVPSPKPVINPTLCRCTSLELCTSNYGSSVITTRVVNNAQVDAGCLPNQVYCCMETTKLGCGIPNNIPGVNPAPGQAHLGQFPWTAIILTSDNYYVGGGVLIDATHVLTVAHRLISLGNGAGLKVRFGDWDLATETEPVGFVEVPVAKLIHHPLFEAATLRNDITIVTLAKPVATLTKPFPQINSICMPEPTATFTGMRCKVAGWGKDQFDGKYQTILKEVEIPVLSAEDCQARLRNTKLGSSFALDAVSFLCAGGEPGKDACTGDGGNALACMKDGKYFVAGLTAAGIQCGNSNIPGLYVNLVNYVPWIDAVIRGNDVVVINPRVNHP